MERILGEALQVVALHVAEKLAPSAVPSCPLRPPPHRAEGDQRAHGGDGAALHRQLAGRGGADAAGALRPERAGERPGARDSLIIAVGRL